jgi:hypothetical protein
MGMAGPMEELGRSLGRRRLVLAAENLRERGLEQGGEVGFDLAVRLSSLGSYLNCSKNPRSMSNPVFGLTRRPLDENFSDREGLVPYGLQ